MYCRRVVAWLRRLPGKLRPLWARLRQVRWRQLRWDRVALAALVIILLLFLLIRGVGALFRRQPADSGSQSVSDSTSTPPPDSDTTDSQAPQAEPLPWNLLLVNNQNPIPEGFSVTTAALPNGLQVDERILPDLTQMIADAKAQGVGLIVCSAYWDQQRHSSLYLQAVNEYLAEGKDQAAAEAAAAADISAPGGSEHCTGLAVDIVTPEYQMLNEGYANTPAAQWLVANAPEYGFILRYPKAKEDVTGILYQPWHFRYVGKEWARGIADSGLSLEEWVFLKQSGALIETPASESESSGFGGGTAGAPPQADAQPPESDAQAG